MSQNVAHKCVSPGHIRMAGCIRTLLAFRRGELVYTGKSHANEYIKTETNSDESR